MATSPESHTGNSTSPATPLPEPIIVLENNIAIRPYHPSDGPQFAHLANNKLIACNHTNHFQYPGTLSTATTFITKILNTTRESGHTTAFAITLSPTSRFIGNISFTPGTDVFARNTEIGFWIGEEYWGQGIMTAVCKAVVDWAFEREDGVSGKKLQRIGAGVFGGNPASGAVLKKCGFEYTGCMKGLIYKWDEVRDLDIYGITRGEWEAMKAA